jgi:mono/diheme cytochrome c family protein
MRSPVAAVVTLVAAAGMAALVAAQESAPQGKSATTPLYTVLDGNKVDPRTLAGWKTWRALSCDRCHGQAQEGLVGPSLVNSLKTLSKEQFEVTVMNGRIEKGMPNFSGSPMMQTNWEGLYDYLKGRSDGNIAPGHLYPLDETGSTSSK